MYKATQMNWTELAAICSVPFVYLLHSCRCNWTEL